MLFFQLINRRYERASGERLRQPVELARPARMGNVAVPDIGVPDELLHRKQVDELADPTESLREQPEDAGCVLPQVDSVQAGETQERGAPQCVAGRLTIPVTIPDDRYL